VGHPFLGRAHRGQVWRVAAQGKGARERTVRLSRGVAVPPLGTFWIEPLPYPPALSGDHRFEIPKVLKSTKMLTFQP